MLHNLKNANTSISILLALEDKLATVLCLKSLHCYNPPVSQSSKYNILVSEAIHSQNLIGWHQFMRGYISQYWHRSHTQSYSNPKKIKQHSSRWDILLTKLTLDLHKQIWEDKNLYVHGATMRESQEKARVAVVWTVTALYNNPPKLAIVAIKSSKYCWTLDYGTPLRSYRIG